jgi:hypothetical protein
VTSSYDPSALFNLDLCGQMAAGVVLDFIQQHGEGPAWAQLAGLMGWGPPREHAPLIYALRELGWLSFTEEPYSLRPGPKYKTEASDGAW